MKPFRLLVAAALLFAGPAALAGSEPGEGTAAAVAPGDAAADRADALAMAPLLNCLLREIGEPVPQSGAPDEHPVYRLPTGRVLRVRGVRRPSDPEVSTAEGWRPVRHAELVKIVEEEVVRRTGLPNQALAAEMIDSRNVVAALLRARAQAAVPEDPYQLSEQSLIIGHPHHPAPKFRGGGPADAWLPYAPEAYARFPLALLGVRADLVVEDGDTSALDALGVAPHGYRLLPAHPWQLDLVARDLAPAFADGRLIHLGKTSFETWPTSSVRSLYAPGRDLFLKFSLDVRITNGVRRLWRRNLMNLRRKDAASGRAVRAVDGPSAWVSDKGYRTADFAFEQLAVVVREGLRGHLLPGATPLLAGGLVEGFDGNPLAATTDPERWWTAYLAQVVPPVFAAFADNGVVLEPHLQNTLVAVDADGLPVQALFRDPDGVWLLQEVSYEVGWDRVVYSLVVNNLFEIAAALVEHHPGFDPWPAARRELARLDRPEMAALLTSPTLPGKSNLLLRWTDAAHADATYVPVPNPLFAAN